MNQREKMLKTVASPWFTLFFLLSIVVSYFYFDRAIATFFHQLNLKQHTDLFHHVTNLALSGFYLASLGVLVLYFKFVTRNNLWAARVFFLWLSVAVPSTIVVGLKMLFGRARPELFLNYDIYGFLGFQTHAPFWSFPSGHTTTIMGLTAGLAYLFPRFRYAFLGTGFLIAFTRIILDRHFLSDILMASYLSILEVSILYFIMKRQKFLTFAFEGKA